MPNYRRRRVPGGTYFFTVNLADADDCRLCLEVDLFRECYRKTAQELPFRTDTIVVLPDHLHAIWTLPSGDADYSERWRRIKQRFSHALHQKHARSESRLAEWNPRIWQPRFWEHTIRNAEDLSNHRAYCFHDPVRHDLVHHPRDWALSSFVKRGSTMPEDMVLDAAPTMRFPVGERDEQFSKGGRIPRPTIGAHS